MGIPIDYDLYEEATNEIYTILNTVAKHYKIEVIQLKWTHFYNYCENVLLVCYEKISFSEKLSKYLSGSIVHLYNVKIISYNDKMSFERRYFTICHEIIHCFLDLDTNDNGRGFQDYIDKSNYDPKEDFIEYRANVGAGLLMCNDESLSIQLYSGKNFSQLRDYFYMSKAAMYHRLFEYVVYKVGINPYHAQKVVTNYISGDRVFFDESVSHYVIPIASKLLESSCVPRRSLAIY